MRSMTRRQFLARTAAAAGLAGVASRAPADPLGLPIGLQLYTVREQLGKDFDGTLRQVAAAGYQEVELFSFLGRKAKAVRGSLDAAGLRCVSAHYPLADLQGDLGPKVEYAKELGLTFLVCPFPGIADPGRIKAAPRDPLGQARALVNALTADDWKWNAEVLNRAGAQAKKAGLQVCYHNHHLEFKRYGDVPALEILLRHADKDLVKIELDCGWVHVAGQSPADFIAGHEGRIALLHIKDVKEGFKPTTDFGPVPFTEVGRGAIDWKKVFAAAKKARVKRYYVEQDSTERPPLEAIKISRDYLHDLTV
jgi:sugar phosphate isomerase/epimerase